MNIKIFYLYLCLIMNIDYVKQNYIALLFFGSFNSVVSYLFYTKQFHQYEKSVLASISIYEFLNIFIEIKNHFIRKEPQIVIYLLHHILSASVCGFFFYYYQPILIFHDMILYSTLLTCTTFYLNLQYVFPRSNLLKIVFAGSFFYYRMILTFPLYVKLVKGFYIIQDFYIVSIIGSICPIFFFCLNLYWGGLILNKFKNKIKLYFDNKKT
jgi:hypothetical protein